MKMTIGSKVVGIAGDAKNPVLLTEHGEVFIKHSGLSPEKFVFAAVNLEYDTNKIPEPEADD